jgi:hypothetical protein
MVGTGLAYGVDLTANGTRYEVRISKTGPLAASYELLAMRSGQWTQVAIVHGGYGTTGEEVVAAVPLALIGAQAGAHLSGLGAFAGLRGLPAPHSTQM